MISILPLYNIRKNKWTVHLNTKGKMIQCLEENIGRHLHDLEVGQRSLAGHKICISKEKLTVLVKVGNFSDIKVRPLALQKTS